MFIKDPSRSLFVKRDLRKRVLVEDLLRFTLVNSCLGPGPTPITTQVQRFMFLRSQFGRRRFKIFRSVYKLSQRSGIRVGSGCFAVEKWVEHIDKD